MGEQLVLSGFPRATQHEMSQYFTPRWLAERMCMFAGLGGSRWPYKMSVLEPSAGPGRIISAAFEMGATDVLANEMDPWLFERLCEDYAGRKDIAFSCCDFLEMEPRDTDIAIMNPPLNGGVGPKHVRHALRFAPRAISVLRAGDLHGIEAWQTLWSHCTCAGIAHLIKRPKFDDGSAMSEFVVVDVRREFSGIPRLEWW